MTMLSEPDREIVLRRLREWITDPPPKQAYLATALLPDESDFFYSLDMSGAPEAAARTLLTACETRGWPPPPAPGAPPARPLLARVLGDLAAFQEIADVLRRLVAPVVPDPFDAHLLIGNRVFVNRVKSRALLRQLTHSPAPMIAVINGARLSGRSHTAYLVGYAAERLQQFHFATVEVKPNVASQWTVDEVATTLVRRIIGRAPELPPGLSEMPARRAHQLADWVLGEAASAPQNWWIILDGVGHVRHGRFFIEAIGEYFSKNTLLRRIRLILIDHPDRLPDSIEPIADMDELPSPAQQLSNVDIENFFREVLAQRADAAELTAAVQAAVQEVHRRAGSSYPADERLMVLGKHVQAVTNEILAAH